MSDVNLEVFMRAMYGIVAACLSVVTVGLLLKLGRTVWHVRNSPMDDKKD